MEFLEEFLIAIKERAIKPKFNNCHSIGVPWPANSAFEINNKGVAKQ